MEVTKKVRFGYDKDGKDIDPGNYLCMAKRIITENKNEKFFIKHFTSGMTRANIVNPHASTFNAKLLKQGVGITDFIDFAPVTKESFEYYIKFLITRNELFLNKAIHSFGE